MIRNATLAAAALLALLPAVAHAARAAAYTRDFDLETCTFTTESDNPFLPLVTGFGGELTTFHHHHEIQLVIVPLDETQVIAGVETRVLELRDEIDDQPVRVRRLHVAECKRNGSIFLFGVDVDEYAGGEIVGHAGSWRAGAGGARVGLLMPGIALLGSRWLEEPVPGALVGEELVAVNRVFTTPDIRPHGCIVIVETQLGNGRGNGGGAGVRKTYCPDIGLVAWDDLRLEGD